MTNELSGTVALVTGASSGIGEATALALADAGADVALLARRADRLDGLADRIRDAGVRALPIAADTTDADAITTAVDQVAGELGRLDVVVANAGLMLLGPIEGADLADWRRVVQVNVMGTLNTVHAALPHLIRAAEAEPRRVSDLVIVSSTSGRRVKQNAGIYALTKHGLNAFAESLRLEITRKHVRVGVIEPGSTASELMSHNSSDVQDAFRARAEGMERLDASDIAAAIRTMVGQDRRVAVNEMLVRPTDQAD